jgi:hypothetical protein
MSGEKKMAAPLMAGNRKPVLPGLRGGRYTQIRLSKISVLDKCALKDKFSNVAHILIISSQ